MTQKKVLSVRLPDSLIESINDTAKSLGVSTAELVEEMCNFGLNNHMDKLIAEQQAKLDKLKRSNPRKPKKEK